MGKAAGKSSLFAHLLSWSILQVEADMLAGSFQCGGVASPFMLLHVLVSKVSLLNPDFKSLDKVAFTFVLL